MPLPPGAGETPIAPDSRSAAYVGILTPGSTSRMRAEWLRKLTPDWTWAWIDTNPPLMSTGRLWQSLAYRHQLGTAVDRINDEVTSHLEGTALDLAWVDKAVFLRPATMDRLRNVARKLVHFTPDTAFGANSSRYFEASLPRFDLVVTTKSFELAAYGSRIDRDRVWLTTQGFDPLVHHPRVPPDQRRREAVFVGLAEPDRERIVGALVERGIPVRLAGRGWSRFVKRWESNSALAYEGEDIFGDDYARVVSGSRIGLGLLSKRFPELHTTRTFEIPACGTVLATERTAETASFFADDEALFVDGGSGFADRIEWALGLDDAELSRRAEAGRRRVLSDRRDYPSILGDVLAHARLG